MTTPAGLLTVVELAGAPEATKVPARNAAMISASVIGVDDIVHGSRDEFEHDKRITGLIQWLRKVVVMLLIILNLSKFPT